MRVIEVIMGMPIEVEVVGEKPKEAIEKAFALLRAVDERFSTYKADSEISRLNRGELSLAATSSEMREVLDLAQKTLEETGGYFNSKTPAGTLDPSGIVKGWAIKRAAELLEEKGFTNYFVNAGGDIASKGVNESGEPWQVGIRNPFAPTEVVKVVVPQGAGVATSGSYMRGAHIYNPHDPNEKLTEIVSVTVVGPDVLEADRFATAAFAMGKRGVEFLELRDGLEGYQIDAKGVATMTSGFSTYTSK